ncbi:hypothetical protein KFL_000460070 [Klebsormidium nitens]|uniref:Uncharacterized protein n=1 Tax=Klebsormidium nitens TaxID=105231 RepID=A0A1Y1HU93_KLENI|nr:hypothetical protein KFL_000460070 [Klebsormidium nitens]|eukprot:GAQ80096.1 hypothetical protein KFL_000460070 [Klebsormidium nitens]
MSMRTDANSGLPATGAPKGRSGLIQSAIPTAISSSWKYLKNVGGGSGVLGEDAGAAPLGAPRIGVSVEDTKKKEQVLWASFDSLDIAPGTSLRVLLLTYSNGFQAWDVHEAGDVRELVSRRDGPVACLRVLPHPLAPEPEDSPLAGARPLLAVVAGGEGFRGFDQAEEGESEGGARSAVRMYSLQSHAYVHALRFRTPVLGVQASRRLVAVALSAQIYCFDAATLDNTFSVLTYPAPQLAPGMTQPQQGAMALGHQWLGYAANQPLITPTGRVSPQCLSTPSPSPSSSPATPGNAVHLVAHYAKESSKQLAAGVISLGDMSYKTLNNYVRELMQPESGAQSANGGPAMQPGAAPAGAPNEQEYAGTVIIRDVVTRNVVAQFRAHTSPLSALAFDPSGTLVVTASVCGHSLNVFRITPQSKGVNPSSLGSNGETHSTAHLYRLHRGLTNAVIQDIRFSSDSEWVAVSTTRGTTHMYAVSRFGGHVGPSTHVRTPDRSGQPPTATWHSANGSQGGSPPGVTLSVVARIRNSNGGWRGSVTGAAAAATGRANMIAGAVATCFHSGRAKIALEERAAGFLEEQLYVLSPQGYLLRYWLRPFIGCDSSSANAPEVLKLAIEPRERWDVCRRVSWVEREERVTYRADGADGSVLGGSEIGPVERGVQTGEDGFLVKAETGPAVSGIVSGVNGPAKENGLVHENGPGVNGLVSVNGLSAIGLEGRGVNSPPMGSQKLFDQRPPRHDSAGRGGGLNELLLGSGSSNGSFSPKKKNKQTAGVNGPANGPFGGPWGKTPNGKGPWLSAEKIPVENGHVAEPEREVVRHLLDGDPFDDQNSEGSFEVSQPSSPPSSFESPRYLLQKHFASSPIPGPFLTPAMLNQRPGRVPPVPVLDLDSEGSLATNPPSTSGDSVESPSPPSPSPRTSPVCASPKDALEVGSKATRGGGDAATTPPAKPRTGLLFALSEAEKGEKSPLEASNVSPDRPPGKGLNGLNLNGLSLGGAPSLWKELDGASDRTEDESGDVEDGGFLSPIVQSGLDSSKKKAGGQFKDATPGREDSSPKSRRGVDVMSRRDADVSSGKAGKGSGKAGDDKGGLLGGLRGLMSSGAQGLAAAVTAVGGAPPRESLLDMGTPVAVEKSAKVYQHPIPVGDRKKPAPRSVRRVPRGGGEAKTSPVVTGGSRGMSPAGSRGVSPVGSPGGFGGSPVDRCTTPNLMDKRGKLLGGRNGERSYSSENLHAEEGPIFTGAVAEAKAGVNRAKKGSGDEKDLLGGDWQEESKRGGTGEVSMDGWEQQGFLEGFSFSEED